MNSKRKCVWIGLAVYACILVVWGCYAERETFSLKIGLIGICWNVMAHTVNFLASIIGLFSLAIFGGLFQGTRNPKSIQRPPVIPASKSV